MTRKARQQRMIRRIQDQVNREFERGREHYLEITSCEVPQKPAPECENRKTKDDQ